MKKIASYIGIVFVTLSCKTAKETMRATTSLFDARWSLRKIYDGANGQNINTRAFIRFDKEKGSAGGNGSCNSFGSSVTINGNEVAFKNVFSTKMYCEQVQHIENKYFKQLANANKFEIKDSLLILYLDNEKLLEFAAE